VIDLYSWPTPNGRKVSIMLEECELDYIAHPIDITKNDQFGADFLKISPNNKIPAITDQETGISLMESGAIMLYLAQKTKKFMPSPNSVQHWTAMQWLMWQMGGLGPMAGQAHHFLKFNSGESEYAESRYQKETERLYGVLEERLAGRDYIVGEYSIADMAIWPWISRYEWQQIDIDKFPAVKKWYLSIAKRPAVQKGYHIPHFTQDMPMP